MEGHFGRNFGGLLLERRFYKELQAILGFQKSAKNLRLATHLEKGGGKLPQNPPPPSDASRIGLFSPFRNFRGKNGFTP